MAPTIHVAELGGVQDVHDRYHVVGPHATVVMPVPKPGVHTGDLRDRWHAVRNNIAHDGASRAMLEHLDALTVGLAATAETVLLSASDESAVWSVLDGPVLRSEWHVGPVPWLLPVLGSLGVRDSVVGAIVDRVGADLLVLSSAGPTRAGEVNGEDEFVHKTTRGGWSQSRHQRHSEVVWDRNAHLVAEAIEALADRTSARLALLTGDERATNLVAQRLSRGNHVAGCPTEAGGRHEPETSRRLHEAAMAALRQRHAARLQELCGRFDEALGRQDRAVDGAMLTLDAIHDRRVRELFLDEKAAQYPLFDAAARDAMDQGADVVLASDLQCLDGMSALLRVPTR